MILGMDDGVLSQKLLTFNARKGRFNTFKMAGKKRGCVACDENSKGFISDVKKYDYEKFTGEGLCVVPMYPDENNIAMDEFLKIYDAEGFAQENLLVDTRPEAQFNVIRFKDSINVASEDILYCQTKEEVLSILKLNP